MVGLWRVALSNTESFIPGWPNVWINRTEGTEQYKLVLNGGGVAKDGSANDEGDQCNK